jgi:hypothetical protein
MVFCTIFCSHWKKRSQKYLREQVFPLLLHKNAKDRFNFEDCRFTLSRSKEATGRIVFRNMGIVNSYTLEASYGGSSIGNKVTSYFSNFFVFNLILLLVICLLQNRFLVRISIWRGATSE